MPKVIIANPTHDFVALAYYVMLALLNKDLLVLMLTKNLACI